jgi:hypothetical protein
MVLPSWVLWDRGGLGGLEVLAVTAATACKATRQHDSTPYVPMATAGALWGVVADAVGAAMVCGATYV